MKKIFLSLFILFLFTACTEEVMKKLQSDTYEPNLSTSFWNKEISENSELWQQALPYCQEHPLKVNCKNVRETWARYNINQHMMANANHAQSRPLARRLLRNRILNNQ